MPEQHPLTPHATFGDWVRTADGTPATVIHAQPFRDQMTHRGGISYTLMYKGGHERDFYHYDGDDHLTIPSRGRSNPNNPAKTVPLFTVVTPDV